MTMYEIASRFEGAIQELPGVQQHPFIQWCHMLCGLGSDAADEVAWCSGFMNAVAFIKGAPRSFSAAARSWLLQGRKIELVDARIGNDVVILKRGTGPQPGPEVVNAPGHVGLYAGVQGTNVWLLGGNQGDNVSRRMFPVSDILGVRRIAEV